MADQVLIVDLETTSVNPQLAYILEVAISRVNLTSKEIDPIIDTLIYPECPAETWLDCWFMANSKLSPEMIWQAPKFTSVRDEVQKQVAALPVTAFNLNFDRQVLYRQNVQMPQRAPCLMLTCKDILKLPGYYNDYKFPKFSEAWGYFFPKEPFEEKHRAGHDVLHEAKLAIALYERGYLGRLFS